MKKFISFIIALILLSSCIGMTSFAAIFDVTLSEDFSELYTDGKTYSMVDASLFQIEREISKKKVTLSENQEETVKAVNLYSNSKETFFFADIKYKNGSTLSVAYLDNNYMNDYNKVISTDVDFYIIDFIWPNGNVVEAKKELLFGNSVMLTEKDIAFSSSYDVYIDNGDDTFKMYAGVILINDDDCYYVDFKELGFDASEWYDFSIYDYSFLEAHKIEDDTLLDSIYTSQDRYYSDDLGFFYDDNFTETISTVFIFFVFAIVPFAIFVLFLILTIRSKTLYKKLFGTVCIFSAAELAVFAIITTLFILLL